MSSEDWDHIRIEGNGPHPFRAKMFRNGVLVPGVTKIVLEGDMHHAWTLTTTQLVNLDGVDGVEAEEPDAQQQ